MQTLSFPRKPLRPTGPRGPLTAALPREQGAIPNLPEGEALYATVISASVAYTVPSSSIHSKRRRPDSVATVKKAR